MIIVESAGLHFLNFYQLLDTKVPTLPSTYGTGLLEVNMKLDFMENVWVPNADIP